MAASTEQSLREMQQALARFMSMYLEQTNEVKVLRDEQEIMRRRISHLEDRLRAFDTGVMMQPLRVAPSPVESPVAVGVNPPPSSAFRPVATSAPVAIVSQSNAKPRARPSSTSSSKGTKRAAAVLAVKAMLEGRFSNDKSAKRPRQRKASVTGEPAASSSPTVPVATSPTLEIRQSPTVVHHASDDGFGADSESESDELDITTVDRQPQSSNSPPATVNPTKKIKIERASSSSSRGAPSDSEDPADDSDDDESALQDILKMLRRESNNQARYNLLENLLEGLQDKRRAADVQRAILAGADEILVAWLDDIIAQLQVAPEEVLWKVARMALSILCEMDLEAHLQKIVSLSVKARAKKLYELAKDQGREELSILLKNQYVKPLRALARQYERKNGSGQSDEN